MSSPADLPTTFSSDVQDFHNVSQPTDFATTLGTNATDIAGAADSAQPTNHAREFGIESFPASLTFTLIYVALLFIYIFRAMRNSTYVLWITALFCQIRIVSFAMRTALIKNERAAQNFDLVLAEQVIYGIGFFGVLYSTYTMVLDREIIKGTSGRGALSKVSGSRFFIRLCLFAAVGLGISGAIQAGVGTKQSTIDLGKKLRIVAAVIFFLITLLLVVHTALSISVESKLDEKDHSSLAPYGLHLLLVIANILLVREVFLLATTNKDEQFKEHLWYPFAAGTELAAIVFFLVPGIVPQKAELVEAKRNQD